LELQPAAWRPHFLMAQACLNQRQYDEAIKESDRALELGHNQAVMVRPILARALLAQGNKARAIKVLEDYLHDRASDAAAQKMLDSLRAPAAHPANSGPD
jgi:predicted Zn-dependent protease